MQTTLKILFCIFFLSLTACASPPVASDDIANTGLTVGLVQKEIREGMDAVAVIEVLGSPNIVKKGQGRPETWIYDKFSSEQVTESASGALAFVSGNTAAAVGGSRGRSKSSVHALTIIIKFDENDRVASLAYHRSKF